MVYWLVLDLDNTSKKAEDIITKIKIKYKIKIERYCDFCERELKASNKSNYCDKTCEHNDNYDKEPHDASIQKDDGERSINNYNSLSS